MLRNDSPRRLGGRSARLAAALLVLSVFARPAAADLVGHGGLIRSIDVSPDGRLALTGSFDNSARLWRFDEQTLATRLEAHDGPINSARFADHGRLAISAGADRKVVVWSVATGKPLQILRKHPARVMSVAVTSDGKAAATLDWGGHLVVWELSTGARQLRVELGREALAVAFGMGDRRLFVGATDGTVRVLGRDGRELYAVPAHDIGLTQLVASADGKRLLTVGHDGKARFWEASSMRPISTFKPAPLSQPVSAAIGSDGATGLVGYLDGRAALLDGDTGVAKREIRAESGPVWAVALTHDQRFGLTAGVDERVRVWHLDSGDPINASAPSGANAHPERPTPWLASQHPGAKLFRKCAACHALTREEPQRAGPHLAGLFGRRSGTVHDYRYSKALRTSTIVWTRSTVGELFRTGPDRFVPGTKMPVQRIRSERRLNELLDYLQQILPAR